MYLLDERRWSRASKIVLLIIITVLLIAPFANKAFHIDIDKKREEYDKAIANYTQALFINLYDPKTFYDRGNFFAKTGEFDRAISDYTQALSIYPYFAGIYVSRGDTYFLKGEYDRAISDYTQALRMDSRDAKTYLRRGEVYFRKGAHDKAWNDVKNAKSLGFDVSPTLLEKLRKSSDAQR